MQQKRKILIRAICNKDIETIIDFLDGDLLHFGCNKSVFLERLKLFFKYFPGSSEVKKLRAKLITCNFEYQHSCILHHQYPVRFQSARAFFVWDIAPTTSGKYRIDPCTSFQEGENIYRYDVTIPDDLLVLFHPNDAYVSLKEEMQEVLKRFFEEQIMFWFPEDLSDWVDMHQDFLERIQNFSQYDYFSEPSFYCAQLEELDCAMHSTSFFKEVNTIFSAIQSEDACGFKRFFTHYGQITNYINQHSFNFGNIDKGYFTFRYFFPNLRFYYNGQEEYFTFLANIEYARKFSGEECDEILNDNDEKDSNDLNSIPF
jgi:hypothetical protein